MATRALVRACLAMAPLAACSMGPAAWQATNIQSLTVGWQQFFRLQWNTGAYRAQPIVEGYIENVWGFWARRIQLLISGYDASGALVGQIVAWWPYSLGPGGRSSFSAAVPSAATYEVAVYAWDWVLDDDREFFS